MHNSRPDLTCQASWMWCRCTPNRLRVATRCTVTVGQHDAQASLWHFCLSVCLSVRLSVTMRHVERFELLFGTTVVSRDCNFYPRSFQIICRSVSGRREWQQTAKLRERYTLCLRYKNITRHIFVNFCSIATFFTSNWFYIVTHLVLLLGRPSSKKT